MTRLVAILSLATLAAAGCADPTPSEDPENGSGQGVDYDEDNPNAPLDDGKSDAPHYAIPSDLPQVVSPEIIVSLDGLTVHLFDRATGFEEVYPAGVGVKDSRGISITPTGHYQSGPSSSDPWFYAPR